MTTIDEDNVVSIEERRQRPDLPLCTLTLRDDFTISMALYTPEGDVDATLNFALAGRQPETFDLGRLRSAWASWRDASQFVA
jgi:hypothetical protein